MDGKFTVGVIVDNRFGVLGRVAGLFAKRGYNIDTLAVGETENPRFSRITIVSAGDDYIRRQVVSQLKKLHNVRRVALFDEATTVSVEHMLIKMRADGDKNAKISELISGYGGKTRDFGGDFITAEITGSSESIDSFIAEARKTGILEICRSGRISMGHGTESMLAVSQEI